MIAFDVGLALVYLHYFNFQGILYSYNYDEWLMHVSLNNEILPPFLMLISEPLDDSFESNLHALAIHMCPPS